MSMSIAIILPKLCPCCLNTYMENKFNSLITQCPTCDYWYYNQNKNYDRLEKNNK